MKHGSPYIVLVCTATAIGLAAFIGSRLSEQAVALMAGALLGLLLALPVGVIIGWALRSQRADRAATMPQSAVMLATQTPPIYQTMPSPITANMTYAAGGWLPQLPPRKYTIGGEEIVHHEPGTVWQS